MLVGDADFSGNGQHVPWVAGHEQNFISRKKVGTIPLWLVPSGFPCALHLQCGRPGFYPWVGKIPWRRERLPTPVFWPGKSPGLYSPWSCKESDTTEKVLLFYHTLA